MRRSTKYMKSGGAVKKKAKYMKSGGAVKKKAKYMQSGGVVEEGTPRRRGRAQTLQENIAEAKAAVAKYTKELTKVEKAMKGAAGESKPQQKKAGGVVKKARRRTARSK